MTSGSGAPKRILNEGTITFKRLRPRRMISAFSQPLYARRVCAGLARADVHSCPTPPTPPRESSGSSVGGGEAQEAACGGSKVAIHAILSRLPDPVLAVRLQDCKVSTFGRALHHTWTPSAGSVPGIFCERQFSAVAKLRCSAHGCVLPRESATIYSNPKKLLDQTTSPVFELHSHTPKLYIIYPRISGPTQKLQTFGSRIENIVATRERPRKRAREGRAGLYFENRHTDRTGYRGGSIIIGKSACVYE